MIEISIPGDRALRLEHLVLDYNGTLACDGALLPGVAERIIALSRQMDVHVVTADTYGGAVAAVRDLPCRVQV
ncbi:MAG: ATPase P, partial [Anaerolineae bacterium]|nr:ATPase P [Anaerolineae bacterium]